MKMNLDMGKTSGLACPCEIDKNEVYYPSFHYDGDEKLDIPRSGTMTIRFRKASSSESEGRNGDEHYSCTIDVLEIVSVEGSEAKKTSSKETEAALDAIKSAKEAEYEED